MAEPRRKCGYVNVGESEQKVHFKKMLILSLIIHMTRLI